ncbi:hypothetical protein U5801_06875 [Lamprobacter modestohalophilus]|uniref:hypothetical protein n=1 Tax=Lamprobacter modestohalophilus TaxID=1064514 RepID=UPI002ADEFA9E|nr:hypothetical protein [Lamprobacter modestohalophilus]MEA1049526.1 hypothetical protein [Lamprobacter modestohalophilus]
MSHPDRSLSSRELLKRIGLNEASANNLLKDKPLDELLHELDGDLGTVLLERYAALNINHAFQPDELVCWKPGLRNRRAPTYGTPAVVLEVLDPPIHDGEQESGSTYFRAPLGLVIGLLWNRDPHCGDFVAFHVDGRRFEPWRGLSTRP